MTSGRLAAFVGTLLSVAMAWPLVLPVPVAAADPVQPLGEFFERDATDQSEPSADESSSLGIRAAAITPAGFTDSVAMSGLTNPIMVRFAADGRIFVAEKSGIIKVFDNLSDATPTVFADLRTNVHDFWDRGMLGMALDPAFPTNPYVYVLYALDGGMGASVPRWNDTCPNPPGATTDGCLIAGRLSRLTAKRPRWAFL